ncbi:hypothetical protein ACFE04_007931 [Oxalis oulophora]
MDRPDNNLQNLRLNILPKKRKVHNDNEAEEESWIPLPARRKHKVSSPEESIHIRHPSLAKSSPSMGKKSRNRKKFHTRPKSSPAMEDCLYEAEVGSESLLLPEEDPAKTARNRRQISIGNNRKNKESMNGDDPDMWLPLNCLVDAIMLDDSPDPENGNGSGEFTLSESVKLSPPCGGSLSKLTASSSHKKIRKKKWFDLNVDISNQICQLNMQESNDDLNVDISNELCQLNTQQSIDELKELETVDNEPPLLSLCRNRSRKSKPKRFVSKPATSDSQANEDPGVEPNVLGNGDNNQIAGSSSLVKTRRSARQKQSVASKGQDTPVLSAADTRREGSHQIWFSLVPAPNPNGGRKAYPRISSSYLRVKDGNMPVSFVQKYLVKKLGLTCESEVEISIRGQPLNPSVPLLKVADWWLHTTPISERRQPEVGEPAGDFVMILSYARKN